MNFSVESSCEDDDDICDIPFAEKTRKRFIYVEDRILDSSEQAHQSLVDEGFTIHDTKVLVDGTTKVFCRCREVIARSKAQCSSKLYIENHTGVLKIFRTANAHDHQQINQAKSKTKLSREMVSEIISCSRKGMKAGATIVHIDEQREKNKAR